MKKIFLRAYYNINLGDDLFIDLICQRYKNDCIFIMDNHNYSFMKQRNSNIKVISNLIIRIYNKLVLLFHKTNLHYSNFLVKKSDALVILCGSMFIEKQQENIFDKLYDRYYNLNKNVFVIGANFGPYFNHSFFKKYEKIFSNVKDVSVRDKKTFNLFCNNLTNIRYAPDLIFGYKKYFPEKVSEREKIFISVINLQHREDLRKYHKQYFEAIRSIVKYYLLNNYEVVLSSFCKAEGDEIMVSNLVKSLEKKVKVVNYNGRIDIVLREMMESKIIVGTRYHSIVLGIMMNKYILPISYSNKINNLLDDIHFKGVRYCIQNLDKIQFDLKTLLNIDQKVINVKDLEEKSEDNFAIFDQFLGDD